MRFLLYDVETANASNMGSICAVGWALAEDMQIVEKGYSLIDPRYPFSPYNVRVHGITQKDVEGAPTFSEYWERVLASKLDGAVLVAHNASFDISATEQALRLGGIQDRGINYIDFMQLAREYLPALESHSLDSLAQWAGVEFNHHQACADACAVLDIARAIGAAFGIGSLEEMIIRSRVPLQNSLTNQFVPKETVMDAKAFAHYQRRERCEDDVECLDRALDGCTFCVTGDVPGYDRPDVERMIREHGGEFKPSVSKKVQFLVVGEYPDYGPGYVSNKQKRAQELIDQGVTMFILSPDEFLAMMKAPCQDDRIGIAREAAQKRKAPKQKAED